MIISIKSIVVALVASVPFVLTLSAQDQRFGVQMHLAQGWNQSLIPQAARAGVGSVRDELYWGNIEQTRGNFTFPKMYDDYMAALAANNISPLIELDFSNPNYDGGNAPYDDDGFNGYANYCTQVLDHYGDQIQAVEIWNEYDVTTYTGGPALADLADTYLGMLQAAYPAIKASHPNVTVVGGGTPWLDLPFWEELCAAGGLDYLDVASIHPYRYDQPPEGIQDEIFQLRNIMKTYNHGEEKPIWATEVGWYTSGDQYSVTPAQQANYLVRAYALLMAAGVDRVYWYLYRDNPEIDYGCSLGLVQEDDNQTTKPAYKAMATMSSFLQGAHFVRAEGGLGGPAYSILFQRDDGTELRVMWATTPTTIYAAGAVSEQDLNGNYLTMDGYLYLKGSPLFVTGPLNGGFPNQYGTVLANSLDDFSGGQGSNSWSYGVYLGGTLFAPLGSFARPTDQAAYWADNFTGLYLTGADQTTSFTGLFGATPVASVRRWTSNYDGNVQISGSFKTEQTGGDGVGVKVVVDGRVLQRVLLGGGNSSTTWKFNLTSTVHQGSTIDFAVDPGSSTDYSYDATAVSATITSKP
ncbi:MAG TPA: glycosyl hydrolase [Opitutaceae bacterium]|nr:glycosyl hydrolase [Opitutaceae bacterium]